LKRAAAGHERVKRLPTRQVAWATADEMAGTEGPADRLAGKLGSSRE